MPAEELERVVTALSTLRVPLQQGEYDLHRLVMDALDRAGLPWAHEVKLGPRCRIDLMVNGTGIEIKRGATVRASLTEQLRRYAACEQITGLVVVAEKNLPLPAAILGKPVRLVCLNRLWGVAL